MTDIIKEELKKKRPNLSENSVKAYVSTLKNLYKKVYGNEEIDIKKFDNQKDFLTHLKNIDGNKRKSILSALVVICDKCDMYKELMLKDAKQYNDEQEENQKTENQKNNWITQEQVKQIYMIYSTEANKLLKLKPELLNMGQLQTIQNFIILCLTAGIFIPPRRSLDWCLMRFKSYSNKDNYYDKKKFVWEIYKTAKFYKKQDMEVPMTLKTILNKWIKLIDGKTDYLLFDSNYNPLSSVKLNQRLNKIFEEYGKISVNMLRHSYITEKYLDKPMPTVKEIKQTAEDMGHSMTQALEYIKK